MKFIILLIHLYTIFFLGANVLVGIGANFQGDWGRNLRTYIPFLKKGNQIWGILLLILLLLGRNSYPFQEFHGHRKLYFETWFLVTRTVLYFGLSTLSVMALERRPYLTIIGIIFAGNFFAYDWGMSLEGEWYSNMYGLLYLGNGAQGAMALLTLLSYPQLSERAKKDFVNFLVTTSLAWFYLQFSQFIILWMGNIPLEAEFYLKRWMSWGSVIIFLVVILKLIPVSLVAVVENLRMNTRIVRTLSALIIVLVITELFWLVRFP